jgi:hypothetical protein
VLTCCAGNYNRLLRQCPHLSLLAFEIAPNMVPCRISKQVSHSLQGTPSGPYCRDLDPPPAEEAAQQKA